MKTVLNHRKWGTTVVLLHALAWLPGCQGESGEEEPQGRVERECSGPDCIEGTSGSGGSGAGTNEGTGATAPVNGAGAAPAASGGQTGVGGADAGGGDTGTGGAVIPPGVPPTGFFAVPARQAVGLEWKELENAESYNVYWATEAGVTPQTGTRIADVTRNMVHRDLRDNTTYYYVITAVTAGVEGPASEEISATPGGEFGLELFGNGDMPDLLKDGGAWVPIARRVHVLILGDGYLANEMDDYAQDVDEYLEDIFTKPIYPHLREAFVFWSMPVVSEARMGNGSAWAMDGQPRHTDETAARIWDAVRQMPYAPTEYFGGYSLEPKNLIVGMMGTDGEGWGYSGYMTTLTEPDSSPRTRVRTAFFQGRAHEFSHAFGYLSDEYFETNHNSASSSETSNIHSSASCESLPWSHLLYGGEFNPGVDQLVGAFGERENDPRLEGTGIASDLTRVHSELKCHINGGHDNSMLYGGSNVLRPNRFCNWCRELITYAAFERTGVLDEDTGWETWKSTYRAGFYDVIGFQTPDVVPQENSLGEAHFDECVSPGP